MKLTLLLEDIIKTYIFWADAITNSLPSAISNATVKGLADDKWIPDYVKKANNGEGTLFLLSGYNEEQALGGIDDVIKCHKFGNTYYLGNKAKSFLQKIPVNAFNSNVAESPLNKVVTDKDQPPFTTEREWDDKWGEDDDLVESLIKFGNKIYKKVKTPIGGSLYIGDVDIISNDSKPISMEFLRQYL